MEERTVAESKTVVSQFMLPTDANVSGNVHGGVIMKLVDAVGGVGGRLTLGTTSSGKVRGLLR